MLARGAEALEAAAQAIRAETGVNRHHHARGSCKGIGPVPQSGYFGDQRRGSQTRRLP
jgi:hypothetical protein